MGHTLVIDFWGVVSQALVASLKLVPVGHASQKPFWELNTGLSCGHITASHFLVVELYKVPIRHWILSLHWLEAMSKAEPAGQAVQALVEVFHKGVFNGHF